MTRKEKNVVWLGAALLAALYLFRKPAATNDTATKFPGGPPL